MERHRSNVSARIPNSLWLLLAVYCAASFVHFAHNAQFVADYPNLPIWITQTTVYRAWFALTLVGISGVALLGFGLRRAGLAMICAYAALGFAGLDHYMVAPVSAHSIGMNATIWCEVAAATLLLLDTLRRLFHRAAVAPGVTR